MMAVKIAPRADDPEPEAQSWFASRCPQKTGGREGSAVSTSHVVPPTPARVDRDQSSRRKTSRWQAAPQRAPVRVWPYARG
jgi:hypothetical protein